MNFFIKDGYNHRTHEIYFDDTGLKDEWQKEVYQYAKKIASENNYSSILDFGCGSGFKLIKNFYEYDTIGIDLPQTVEFLQTTYPGRTWATTRDAHSVDVFIASDVIEHMLDPDVLIEYIKQCNPREIIISTPVRVLISKMIDNPTNNDGPPSNPAHVREWDFTEFYNYISEHFDIKLHIITNKRQGTQLVHCKIKQ